MKNLLENYVSVCLLGYSKEIRNTCFRKKILKNLKHTVKVRGINYYFKKDERELYVTKVKRNMPSNLKIN